MLYGKLVKILIYKAKLHYIKEKQALFYEIKAKQTQLIDFIQGLDSDVIKYSATKTFTYQAKFGQFTNTSALIYPKYYEITNISSVTNWFNFIKQEEEKVTEAIEKSPTCYQFETGFYDQNLITDYINSKLGRRQVQFNVVKMLNVLTSKVYPVVVVRLVGSNSLISHGEMYDTFFNPDKVPDMYGRYRNININCNFVEEGAVTDGDEIVHTICTTVPKVYADGVIYEQPKLYWLPVKAGVHHNVKVWFTDCDGRPIEPGSAVKVELAFKTCGC